MSPSVRSSARPSSRRRSKKAAQPASDRPFVAHHMVPPHEVLSEEETKRTLETLRTSPDRLPKIYVTDPGLKTDTAFVKAREAGERMVGRLARIRRPSETAGEAIAYRLIVAPGGEE